MVEPDARTLFVITTRGERGPHDRRQIAELLRSGEIQSEDRLRNAFGRPLGTVGDLLATRTLRRVPAQTDPKPTPASRSGRYILIGMACLVVLALALSMCRSGSQEARSTPPVTPTHVPGTTVMATPATSPPATPPPATPPLATPPLAQPPPQPGLPLGWIIHDIGGAVTPPELIIQPDGHWSVSSAGLDIWDVRDQFRLVATQLPSYGSVTARVHRADGLHAHAKFGVMLRSSSDPSAAFVLLAMNPAGRVETLMRGRDGGTTGLLPSTQPGMPCWLRLRRTSVGIEPLSSTDGKSWLALGSIIPALPSDRPWLAGIAVCSHEETVMHAVFSDVSVQPAP